jgi:hypothetical protein
MFQHGPAKIERGLDVLSDGQQSLFYFALAAAVFDLERDAVANKIKGFRGEDLRIPALRCLVLRSLKIIFRLTTCRALWRRCVLLDMRHDFFEALTYKGEARVGVVLIIVQLFPTRGECGADRSLCAERFGKFFGRVFDGLACCLGPFDRLYKASCKCAYSSADLAGWSGQKTAASRREACCLSLCRISISGWAAIRSG